MHVQHGLTNVRRKRLAETLPHLVPITFTFFKQLVVLKAKSTDTDTLDLDQHVFTLDVDVTVCVTEEEMIFIRYREFGLHHDPRFLQPFLPLTVDLVAFFKDIESLKTKRLFDTRVSLDRVPRRTRAPVLLANL